MTRRRATILLHWPARTLLMMARAAGLGLMALMVIDHAGPTPDGARRRMTPRSRHAMP